MVRLRPRSIHPRPFAGAGRCLPLGLLALIACDPSSAVAPQPTDAAADHDGGRPSHVESSSETTNVAEAPSANTTTKDAASSASTPDAASDASGTDSLSPGSSANPPAAESTSLDPDENSTLATEAASTNTSEATTGTSEATTEPTSTCDPNASLECPCPDGQLRCYGVCTDPLTDADHCGASDGCELTASPGIACQPLNAVCDGGECTPCQSPLVACANHCIDPSQDQTYCGAAPGCSPQENTRGDRCWNPELCITGACIECVVFTARSGSVPDHAGQLALGEVTGDDLPDVITTSGDPAAIVIIPGAAGESVAEAVSLPFGQAPSALGLGRIDDDGLLDVLVGDDTAGTVQVALGDGVGNFEPGASYAVPGGPRQILLGDFNDDQNLDALVVSRELSQISVLLSNGDGTFESATPVVGDKALHAAALGDVNGDGHLDAVAVGLANSVMILVGNGDGSFTVSSHPSDGYGSAVGLADLDGDQHLDLVATPTLSGYNVEVSIGNGDGTFQDRHRLNAGFSTDGVDNMPEALVIADYDGDAQPDVVVGMQAGITILWGHQNWGADYRRAVTEYSEFTGLLAGDINGDGVLDILASLYNTNQDFRVYYGSVPAECPALDAR